MSQTRSENWLGTTTPKVHEQGSEEHLRLVQDIESDPIQFLIGHLLSSWRHAFSQKYLSSKQQEPVKLLSIYMGDNAAPARKRSAPRRLNTEVLHQVCPGLLSAWANPVVPESRMRHFWRHACSSCSQLHLQIRAQHAHANIVAKCQGGNSCRKQEALQRPVFESCIHACNARECSSTALNNTQLPRIHGFCAMSQQADISVSGKREKVSHLLLNFADTKELNLGVASLGLFGWRLGLVDTTVGP